MSKSVRDSTKRQSGSEDGPYHVVHDTFSAGDAEWRYGPEVTDEDFSSAHMPDEVTRDRARRMHYAAYRASRAQGPRRAFWRETYLRFRDAIVLGNHKLIYRAVRRWGPPEGYAEDMIGDCQIVLIQAVAAYNPWLGVRFSTYAFTCLMRALSRLSRRQAADRLSACLPLDVLPGGEPCDAPDEPAPAPGAPPIEEFLREGHDLLSWREKCVLKRRFRLEEGKGGTLQQVGREMGLSKERVRQVQASALGKLRKALLGGAPAC